LLKIPTDVNPPVGHCVDPTGEAQNRGTPAHLEAYKNCRVGGEMAHVAGVKVTAQIMAR